MYEFSTQRQTFSSIVSQFCDAGRSEPLSLVGQEASRKPRKSDFRMTFRSHSFLALLLLHYTNGSFDMYTGFVGALPTLTLGKAIFAFPGMALVIANDPLARE
jgi:hypothetical protein